MSEAVQFWFDPRCPWCYQTSRWALRLQELGRIELSWGVFCLELNNFDGPHDKFDGQSAKSGRALRTAVRVREQEGEAACGRFYAAVGRRYFYQLENLAETDVVRNALEDAGLDPGIHDEVMADPATWDNVQAEHEGFVAATGGFGVPTLRLGGQDGPCMFGPVISEPPSDEEAVELFEHTSWLIRNTNFHELKGSRLAYPDLPHIAKSRAERAKAKAEAEAQAQTT